MIDWRQWEDAFQAAIARASGLPVTQVVWKHGNVNAPPLDYVALSLGGSTTIGIDYIRQTYDGTRAQGQEFELAVQGEREVPLEIECFTVATNTEAAARALAERSRSALLLPSVRGILTAVGVSPFDPGSVRWIPDVVSAGFRGRASCSVRCYMPAPHIAEYVGYIASVRGTMTVLDGPTGTKTIPFTAP